MKIILLATFLMLPLCAQPHPAFAGQSQSGKADQKRANSITGRLVTESGQPIANAVIYVIPAGKLRSDNRSVSTDDEGRFRMNDLARGVYHISPNAPGYIVTDKDVGERLYRAGDTANITMAKGSVITGTVTNSSGEPVIALTMHALLVKDKDGRAISNARSANGDTLTDDRGMYRFYGLPPGSYLIHASGHNVYYYESHAYETD